MQNCMLNEQFVHVVMSKRKAQSAKKEVMKRRRTLESEQEKIYRKEQDRVYKESMRISESNDQTLKRQEQDRVHKETKRASETHEQLHSG